MVLTVRESAEALAGAAETTAAEGAVLARARGGHATAISAKSTGNVASSILAEAVRIDAAAVVMGTRGRSAVRATSLGSVSAAVSGISRRPVLVVRAPAVESQAIA